MSRDTHVSSIDLDQSLFDEEQKIEGHREAKDLNKQIKSAHCIHTMSDNTAQAADSGNEASKKSFIVRFSDISYFSANVDVV